LKKKRKNKERGFTFRCFIWKFVKKQREINKINNFLEKKTEIFFKKMTFGKFKAMKYQEDIVFSIIFLRKSLKNQV